WSIEGGVEGTIKELLINKYKVPTSGWKLTAATGMSADGYTICGLGINPEGKQEGWVAVMPPILHPPVPVNPGTQYAKVAEPFALQIEIKNPSSDAATFTAKGLPMGFTITSSGRIS